jgi:hypothetical protein
MSFTQQQLFDMAYLGVMKQGGPTRTSSGKLACLYTDDAGRHCAVGQCLTTEQQIAIKRGVYHNAVGVRLLMEKGEAIVTHLGQDNVSFLWDMQQVHDATVEDVRTSDEVIEDEDAYFLQAFELNMRTFATLHLLTVPHFEKSAA